MASSDFRVLCQWDVSFCPWVLDRLRQVASVDVMPPGRDVLLERLHAYDALLVSLKTPLDGEILSRAAKLRYIVTPTTGLDHLDLPTIAQKGIELQSIKTEYDLLDRVTATAELAWGLMLAAVRKLPMAHQTAMQGRWARDDYRGMQLSGKTLGILGVGRLGRMMAEYGNAFRMRVLGCDHSPRFQAPGVAYVDFDTLLAQADVLSIHIHLTPENRHLIDAAAFAKMKKGVVIINTSRGGIIDEQAFVDAIRSGKVGGAGLDVIEGEWRTDLTAHPLIALAREHPNMVIVPHIGGITVESQAMTMQFCADRLAGAINRLLL